MLTFPILCGLSSFSVLHIIIMVDFIIVCIVACTTNIAASSFCFSFTSFVTLHPTPPLPPPPFSLCPPLLLSSSSSPGSQSLSQVSRWPAVVCTDPPHCPFYQDKRGQGFWQDGAVGLLARSTAWNADTWGCWRDPRAPPSQPHIHPWPSFQHQHWPKTLRGLLRHRIRSSAFHSQSCSLCLW